MFWCPKFYHEQLQCHLTSDAFECPQLTAPAAVQKVQADVRRFGLNPSSALPYIYILPKLHKLDQHRAKVRTIAGKSSKNVPQGVETTSGRGTVLTAVSKNVAKALNSCIDLLVLSERRAKVRRCWILRDSQEFIDVFGKLPKEVTRLKTADFTTMYTQLPHNDIIAGVTEALRDVAEILSKRFACSVDDVYKHVCFSLGDAETLWSWSASSERKWTLGRILDGVKTILANTYVLTNGALQRQKRGIFMGDEASPPIANLFLYSKEKRFVNAAVERLGEDEVVRRFFGFQFNARYIDDLISPAAAGFVPSPSEYGLDLVDTGEGSEVVFLGIQVSVENEVTFKARDKQHAFSFAVVRFPTWHSTVPERVRTGTVIGMLVRTLRLTTTTADFLHEAEFLFGLFQDRGYRCAEMKCAVVKFTQRHINPRHSQAVREAFDRLLRDWTDPAPVTNRQITRPRELDGDDEEERVRQRRRHEERALVPVERVPENPSRPSASSDTTPAVPAASATTDSGGASSAADPVQVRDMSASDEGTSGTGCAQAARRSCAGTRRPWLSPAAAYSWPWQPQTGASRAGLRC